MKKKEPFLAVVLPDLLHHGHRLLAVVAAVVFLLGVRRRMGRRSHCTAAAAAAGNLRDFRELAQQLVRDPGTGLSREMENINRGPTFGDFLTISKDPDPLARCMDPDPDSSIIKQKE
jgi:hypothetical protein